MTMTPYFLQLFSWIIYYFILSQLSQRRFNPWLLLILTIISCMIDIFFPYYVILIFIVDYLVLHRTKDYILFNAISLSLIIQIITQTSNDFLSNNLLIFLLEIILPLILLCLCHLLHLEKYIRNQTPLTSIIFGYILIVLNTIIVLLKQYSTYPTFTTSVLIFILFQTIVMSVIFFHQRNKRQQTYQDRFSTEQIKNLKMYTDQLETDQLKLRHFKHDYKNLLFSLKTVVQTKDTQKINEAINKLENYSDEYLNGLSMDLYQDLKNVQNPYLKSLFIGKLNLINQHQIACHFHCSQQLSEVPMNIYDLIGLLDTAIDNAIFFSRKQDPGEIYLSVTQEGHQLAFLIYNSITKNSSTEENGHLEALNIKELKQKYSNLFIQYNQNSKWFRFHVTLITKGD
ncbi:hypothetical protein [Companilactobacillus sp. HBUAS59544]|uniref:hypothetical protein n=1 Tax=Companilactobacillus sp. HBUAS59544 TaxID=3109363 RepID=UPI003FA60F9B